MAAETARTLAEVNEYLAERLLGLRQCHIADCGHAEMPHEEHDADSSVIFVGGIPDSAGTWPGCGAVLEAMHERGYQVIIRARGHQWSCDFGGDSWEYAPTLPEAVARAAVAALEAEAS